MQVSGRFTIGQNFDLFIIRAIMDYFGASNTIQEIIPKKEFTQKRKNLGEVTHYYIEMGHSDVKQAILAHFDRYPLFGQKLVTYEV
jgi:hypothetical protein